MQANRRAKVALAQIATLDLDIGIVSQLPAANLPFGDQLEAGPIQVVGFEAAPRRRALVEQSLEHAPGNPNDALILADAYAELDHGRVGVPAGVRGKTKEHAGTSGGRVPVMFSHSDPDDKSPQFESESASERRRADHLPTVTLKRVGNLLITH